jgi:hypothetical protein
MSSEDADLHTNPEIGRSLERARTERGLSLWQVEEATKIRVRYLRDLERENFDVLPAVYVLGSLKTYADFLDLDGEALSRQLKDRQASLQQEEDSADEEPVSVERSRILAALGGLPVIGDRGALEDDEDVAAPATATGQSPRLYLGLGAVLILIFAVALTTMLGGGDQPAVSQLREPAITEPPSRLVASGNVEDPKEDARNRAAGSGDDRSEAGAESSDERDTKDDQERQEQTKKGEGDEDDAEPEVAEDVEITPPSASTASAGTASAGTASASASATAAASATSAPFATAPADASSTVSAPASGAPVAPDAAAPQAANAGVAPRPAVDQPAPGAAGAPAGARRVVAADGAGPVERVVDRVRIVRFR